MAHKISKKDAILARLKQEGKIARMDEKGYQVLSSEMNESLMEIRREYQVKERESQVSSSQVILNA